MSRVLVIGDIHEPCAHPRYLKFCRDIYTEWSCDTVVFIGDIVDHHAVSFHAAHPECPGPSDEYELARKAVQKWYRAFPAATVLIGNHDARIIRLAESVNIPAKYLRDFPEVWGTPNWAWVYEYILDGVYYVHGTGRSGLHPAYNLCKDMSMSVVMGHIHHCAGYKWRMSPVARLFGMDVGCGIDRDAWAFAYGKHMVKKPALGVGIILDGTPYHEIMPLATGEKYSKKRAKK